MRANDSCHDHIARNESTASAVAAFFVHEVDCDTPGIMVPCLETQIVVRFGPMARGGLDVHAIGGRQQVHRKLLLGGQRTLLARLRLGMNEAVLGVPASAIVGHTVALDDLWGSAAARLFDQLAGTRDMVDAAAVLQSAISERLKVAKAPSARSRFALGAAELLASANVDAVATQLGMSARHLRRVFRDALGMSPKAYARLTRFQRALHIARDDGHEGWASVAAAAGYYDQAHLIAEFHAIAGVTPRALVDELRGAPRIGLAVKPMLR